MGLRSLACVRECSALLGLALALAIGAGDGNLFSYRRVGSGGRLLPWAISPLRSHRGKYKRGRPAGEKRWRLRCDWGWVHCRSVILRQLERGKGNGCFCNRRGRGDGCDLSVGRVVASSPLGGWRSLGRATPWMRAAGRGTLLRILCSSGMLLCWLLPNGLRWLLHSRTPLSSSHSRRGLLLSRWLLHSGRGLLLSNSRWFLPNILGRFHTRMFHR
ncbi:hypothetical protein BHM03_00063155 [Ensete ventricosum]|nr:hypothetical protein BHM03_00063155 [Ensete ventricosum]